MSCAILAQRYWRRLMVRGRKLLTTHRFGRLVLLVLEPFTGRLHDFTTAGALLRRAASPLGAPFTAASMLGVAVRYAVGRFMAVMPGMDGMPAGQILQLADGVRWRAQYGATAVAFVGIYSVALSDLSFTAGLLWLLARLSPGGRLPPVRWLLWRTSTGVVFLSLFVIATGFLAPYFRPGATPLPIDRLQARSSSLLVAGALLVLFHQLRLRHMAFAQHDIWGSRWKAVVATLLKLALLLALPWLLAASTR
jgi:hypothetical protein